MRYLEPLGYATCERPIPGVRSTSPTWVSSPCSNISPGEPVRRSHGFMRTLNEYRALYLSVCPRDYNRRRGEALADVLQMVCTTALLGFKVDFGEHGQGEDVAGGFFCWRGSRRRCGRDDVLIAACAVDVRISQPMPSLWKLHEGARPLYKQVLEEPSFVDRAGSGPPDHSSAARSCSKCTDPGTLRQTTDESSQFLVAARSICSAACVFSLASAQVEDFVRA